MVTSSPATPSCSEPGCGRPAAIMLAQVSTGIGGALCKEHAAIWCATQLAQYAAERLVASPVERKPPALVVPKPTLKVVR